MITTDQRTEFDALIDSLYQAHYTTMYDQQAAQIKQTLDGLKARNTQFLIDFTVYCLLDYIPEDDYTASQKRWAIAKTMDALYRATIPQSEADFVTLFNAMREAIKHADPYTSWGPPVLPVLKQLERFVAKNGLSKSLEPYLADLADSNALTSASIQSAKETDKIRTALAKLRQANATAPGHPPVRLDEGDAFGRAVNQSLDALADADKNAVYGLLTHLKTASGGKPSAKFLATAATLWAALPDPHLGQTLARQWLTALTQVEVQTETRTVTYPGGRDYSYQVNVYLLEVNSLVARGFVWSMLGRVEGDAELMALLPRVVEKSYQKIPGQGPAAAGIGNACLYVLGQSGMAGVATLSRLKLRIKQANTQALIGQYIQAAAVAFGVSPEAIEDMAVVDYGLTNGTLTQAFSDYRAELSLVSVGKVDIRWSKSDGTSLKSEPAAVKKAFAVELKQLKATATDIAKNLTTQRDRLDRSLILDRPLTWKAFTDQYAQHGLMQFLTRQLIWTVERDGHHADVFWQIDGWATLDGQRPNWVGDNSTVRLWHPVGKPVETVVAWREFMTEREIRQPVKQAYREVYLLTDAEVRTRTYSNRMAAHILKQHQFNTLAKGRGWRYSLLGAYDKGYENEKAVIDLPSYNLRAEFWVTEVNADGAWNDTGIWLYVATDQVRFTRPGDDTLLELTTIPPLVLSEIMRDVDLFVGVASVGNDPNWRDGGLTQYRTYWENYSFGELGELAKTRKQALERLVPRLKIARVATVQDRFLVVRGKLRTYKIHLGSGNILMEPNDQYLCIVPDRSPGNVTGNVFLPFEGDALLSVILSKAFLLADDDKITDPTITRQIGP